MTVTVLTAVSVHLEAEVATRVEAASGTRLVRRCADVEDLLAAGAARVARTAVISADLPQLDRTVVADLRAAGVLVVGVFAEGAEDDQRRLRQLTVERLISAGAPAGDWSDVLTPPSDDADGDQNPRRVVPDPGDPTDTDIDAAISRELLGEQRPVLRPLTGASVLPAPSEPAADVRVALPRAQSSEPSPPHRVVAVWGPTGAPGRTTVAVNLAAEMARLGRTVVLVDADTYGASVAQHLALLDEAPGVAAAARLADAGVLDQPRLASIAPEVAPGFRVLTGLPRADRWPELREDAFVEVLAQCRTLADVTVVDVGFCLEEDEELSYDTRAPRRNATTTAALRVADDVLAVGAADPVGLQRLVRGLDELRAFTTTPHVVVTKVRSAAVGGSPERRVQEALDRFAGVGAVVTVPDDRAALDAAMLAGQTLAEAAPGSAARRAMATLAGDLVGVDVVLRRRRPLRPRRGRSVEPV
ncbi:AAA family ATPase [Luteipulveratus halotolerans]|uniref:CobQ/CobB/MinD/ParA nucleotide binding domain-containing protein n=1 Tax=Luteipulveratus halotolerans TaxID=1631356 RepID=A0A0L6CIT8_9MICO|nr:P-loop NTPase [Luteipulveratus halotolerans]KNX37716.1 hypothetical protein VV01_12090 [Luteipulveratus halotolerans]